MSGSLFKHSISELLRMSSGPQRISIEKNGSPAVIADLLREIRDVEDAPFRPPQCARTSRA
jgi:hypothetical protein